MPLAQDVEFPAAPALVLEGDDLVQALYGIDRVGTQLARRLAGAGAEFVHPVPHGQRAQRHDEQERRQGERQPRAVPGQHQHHHARSQDGQAGGGNGVGKKVLDQLDILGGDAHQIAGAPPHQIGGRQSVQLAEEINPHLGE